MFDLRAPDQERDWHSSLVVKGFPETESAPSHSQTEKPRDIVTYFVGSFAKGTIREGARWVDIPRVVHISEWADLGQSARYNLGFFPADAFGPWRPQHIYVGNAEVEEFSGLTVSHPALGEATESRRVLLKVRLLHQLRKFTLAADTLLNYLVDMLEARNLGEIDCLIAQLTTSLRDERDLYNDRGLARILNVLALTLRHERALKHRQTLREAYRLRVEELEGSDAANTAAAAL